MTVTNPSWIKSPRTRDVSSCKCSEEPGIPIAERRSTRSPLNGVTVPRYGTEAESKGI